jgi:hypothetical protein
MSKFNRQAKENIEFIDNINMAGVIVQGSIQSYVDDSSDDEVDDPVESSYEKPLDMKNFIADDDDEEEIERFAESNSNSQPQIMQAIPPVVEPPKKLSLIEAMAASVAQVEDHSLETKPSAAVSASSNTDAKKSSSDMASNDISSEVGTLLLLVVTYGCHNSSIMQMSLASHTSRSRYRDKIILFLLDQDLKMTQMRKKA